jgi:hypothetical protein
MINEPTVGGFTTTFVPKENYMKFKDLVDSMSAEFNMPAADAKKIAKFVLDKLAELIDKKEEFSSPKIKMIIRETSERKVISRNTGELKTIPAQTHGIVKLKIKSS